MICGIINVEVRVISRAEGESDNSYREIDNLHITKTESDNCFILYILSLFPRAIDAFRPRKSLKRKMP